MFVSVSHLSRTFGQGEQLVHAVRDVSFGLERGDIVGLIGPNGAGKSTTMRCLATLDQPTSGSCTVDGFDCVDDADEVRHRIGYMPDSYGAYPNCTVAEYLDFFARSHGLAGEHRRRAVADLLAFCQLDGIREKLVTTLSKGMKQRLCLGRCLIHDPPFLILDEPSAGLDPRARIEFRELLRILAGRGKAILVSSHILAELEELCSTVVIFEQGRLMAAGRVADLTSGHLLDQVAAAQEAPTDGSAPVPRTARSEVLELRLASPHDDLAAALAEEPELTEVRIEGTHATARVAATPAQRADVLRRLLDRGLPVCHFGLRARDLEDVFMSVTEGKVQ